MWRCQLSEKCSRITDRPFGRRAASLCWEPFAAWVLRRIRIAWQVGLVLSILCIELFFYHAKNILPPSLNLYLFTLSSSTTPPPPTFRPVILTSLASARFATEADAAKGSDALLGLSVLQRWNDDEFVTHNSIIYSHLQLSTLRELLWCAAALYVFMSNVNPSE